jgi:hypothetical protein
MSSQRAITSDAGARATGCSVRFAVVLLCICVSAVGSWGQNAPPRQLTLIQPNDSSFDQLVSTNFPGLDRLDGYAIYRPFLVLLRNDTSHVVRAYMIQWEARSLSGEPFQLADRIERYSPALASERIALAPGEMRLVSDHFDVSPKEYESEHQGKWVATMISQAGTNSRYSSADPNSAVAAVDAAVFDDGLCVGPDHHQIFLRYQREMDAEHDMADAILRLLDQKAPETDVVAFLKAEADAAAAANQSLSGSAFLYAYYRGRQAQTLLTLHHRGGLESVMTRAWRVQQHPRQKLVTTLPQ